MISGILVCSTFFAGSIITTAKAFALWPLPRTTIPESMTVNTTTVAEVTTRPFNSTPTVRNSTDLQFNNTAIISKGSIILLDPSEKPDTGIVLLEPIVPPLANVAKRQITDYTWVCAILRDRGLFDARNIDRGYPVGYVNSYCVGASTIMVGCRFVDRLQNTQKKWTPAMRCAENEVCEETGLFDRSRAWCRPGEAVSTVVVRNGDEAISRLRSANPVKQHLAAVSKFYDAADGSPRAVANVTFITSTPDHTRTEIDLSRNILTSSKDGWMGFNEGWDIYVSPGTIPGGDTIVDTWLTVLS